MKKSNIINEQLIKNMILNLIAFTIIFSILGIIIYTQVSSSLYKSSDQELMNYKNRVAIMQEFKNNFNAEDNSSDTTKKQPPEDSIGLNNTNKKMNPDSIVNPRLAYIYRDSEGNIIEESGKYSGEYFEDISFEKTQLDKIYSVTVGNQYEYRAINYKMDDGTETKYVQVLINIDAEQTIIKDFSKTLIISIIATIALSIIASYLLSKKTLKPVINAWNKQSEFVQNASHELRTPLTIIQAKQELLLDEPDAKIIEKAEEINSSLNETRRMTRLVKDLMQLARADSDKIQLQKQKCNIDNLIFEVSKPFTEMAKMQSKKFELNLKYNKEINIDQNKIHQVLVIILDNAIKYTEKNDTINISTYEKDGKCAIDIADTGIGISDEGIKYVFDRFYRDDKARSRETGGSGLGLSIAHNIIDMHGGTIKAVHNTPKGTKIEIKLK